MPGWLGPRKTKSQKKTIFFFFSVALMEQETSRPTQGIHLHNLVSWFQHSCPSCDFQRPNYQQCTRSPLALPPSLESRRAVPRLLTTSGRLRPYRPASCRSPPLNFLHDFAAYSGRERRESHSSVRRRSRRQRKLQWRLNASSQQPLPGFSELRKTKRLPC